MIELPTLPMNDGGDAGGPILGIDLGTTNSLVAIHDACVARVLTDA